MDKKYTSVVVLSIVAILLSIVTFTSSNKTTGSDASTIGTLAKIQATKTMDVCYAVWPPAVIKDASTGELSGHDIDAMRLLAKGANAEIVFHETTFGDMAGAIQSGVCDIGTSLFVNIPRSAAVAFSRPILYGGDSGLVRKGDTRFKTVADIDKPGIVVATATGEAGDIYAKANFTQAKIVSIDVQSSDLSRFLLEVTSGRADIGIADANTIRLFAAAHPESTDALARQPFGLSPDAFPIRHGNQDFLNFVNNSLLSMQIDGTWSTLEQKYDAHWLHELQTFGVK